MNKILRFSKPDSLSIAEAIERFGSFREAYGLAEKTILLDRVGLAEFSSFCNRAGSVWLKDLSPALIDDYLKFLRNEKISQKTGRSLKENSIRKYYDVLKVFEAYLISRERISPFIEIRRPPVTKRVTQTFSTDQLLFLIEKSSARYRILFRLLINTGMRISESLRVGPGDIFMQENMIAVRETKNRKERLIPFSPDLRADVQALIDTGSLRLFPMSSSAVRKYLHRLRDEQPDLFAGVEVRPHVFRHTFAKTWIMSDGDPISLQHMLGHSSSHMTTHYVQLFAPDLRTKHAHHALLI